MSLPQRVGVICLAALKSKALSAFLGSTRNNLICAAQVTELDAGPELDHRAGPGLSIKLKWRFSETYAGIKSKTDHSSKLGISSQTTSSQETAVLEPFLLGLSFQTLLHLSCLLLNTLQFIR